MKRLLALLCVVASSFAARADDVPLPRPRPATPPAWSEPHSFHEAAGPDFDAGKVTDKPTECSERLAKIGEIALMPRLIGPGACGGEDIVRLDAVRVDDKRVILKPAPYLRCPMAEQLALWVRDDAAPSAAGFGAALQTVETFDDFSCRGRNRQVHGKLSEHGKGNAVDVRAFALSDGRQIALTDVNASKAVRDSLHDSACRRFTTVLGPDSDGFHEEHIHLDLIERRNGYRICQWAVHEPRKAIVVSVNGQMIPLPPPRPTIGSNRKL
jgi:hypothetical protein